MLDNPVPNKYLQRVQRRDDNEFTHMRYTAATCDPADFQKDNYRLRQNLLARETELFIVLTMYNVSDAIQSISIHCVNSLVIYRKTKFFFVEL